MGTIEDGIYYLSGVDRCSREDIQMISNEYYDGNGVAIELQSSDGEKKTYAAIEDECDGYRSMGHFMLAPNYTVKNTFEPEKVRVFNLEGEDDYGTPWKMMEIRSYYNNSLILKVGTENYDDWYPVAIFEWYPENLRVNRNR